ncbi:MAG TPA: hypothetical protein VE326_08160 [Candidatus Binatia bacterium]|nr:hypothetical protein [Candidatus Binatia bacterium]
MADRKTTISVTLLTLGLLALGALPCRAGSSPAAPADSVLWIGLERGDSLEARAVEMAANDFVRYRTPDGAIRYLPANRIAHIYDRDGTDFQRRVLRDRKSVPGPAGGSTSSKYSALAFRGGDRTHCASFLLTEAGVFVPLTGAAPDQNLFGSVDVGWMGNVGRSSAVGTSAFWESGTNHNRGGVRLRYRRWLNDRLSLELSPGVVLSGNDTYDPPGYIGQAALNMGDLMSVVVEGEHERFTSAYGYWNGSSTVSGATQHTSNTTLRVGLRGGSYIGAGSMFLAGIALAALAAAFGGGTW